MGLLDEAIREHLELKRRRGGDPTEIAREEREALEPVFPQPDAPDDGVLAEAGEPLGFAEQPPAFAQEAPSAEPTAGEGFSSIGEETAELDMQSVLADDGGLTEEHRMPVQHEGEAEFEWDAPPAAERGPPEVDPGQERLDFQ